MYKYDYRNIAGGLLLAALGAFIVWHGSNTLRFGTIREMGPGMFPIAVGYLLIAFGFLIAIPAFFRRGTLDAVEWRPFIGVMASGAVFALMLRPFGLVPAIAGLIVVSNIAEATFRPRTIAVMCIVLPALAVVVFRLALGMPLPVARWPF